MPTDIGRASAAKTKRGSKRKGQGSAAASCSRAPATRHLSVYDGQRFLGSIIGCDEEFVARDNAANPLGTFATVQEASSAISKADGDEGEEVSRDGTVRQKRQVSRRGE